MAVEPCPRAAGGRIAVRLTLLNSPTRNGTPSPNVSRINGRMREGKLQRFRYGQRKRNHMLRNRSVCLVGIATALFATGGQPWKEKPASDWTDADAREVLTDSPWAKTVHPTMENPNNG